MSDGIKSIRQALEEQAAFMAARPPQDEPGPLTLEYDGELSVRLTPGIEKGNSTYTVLEFETRAQDLKVTQVSDTLVRLEVYGGWELGSLTDAFRVIGGYFK